MANNFIAGTFFFILSLVFLFVFLNLPDVITANPSFNLLFALFPFVFAMLGVLVVVK